MTYFQQLYDVLIILVDFLFATRIHTGSVSWFHVEDMIRPNDKNPDPQHYGIALSVQRL